MPPMKYGVGQAGAPQGRSGLHHRRQGRYVDDEQRDGVLRGYVLRSPHAHARFTIRDRTRGGADAGRPPDPDGRATCADLGDLPCQALMKNADGTTQKPQRYPGAADRYGAPCRRRRRLRRRRQHPRRPRMPPRRSRSTIEPLEAIVDQPRWRWSPARRWSGRSIGTNLAYDAQIGDRSKVAAAFDKAARIVTLDVINNRLVANYLEPRGCVGEWDGERFTLTVGSQGVHGMRDTLAASIFRMPVERVPREDRRRRRRLRHQGLHVSRISVVPRGGASPRPAGEVVRRSHRALSRRHAGPRQRHAASRRRSTAAPGSWPSRSTSSATWAPICRSTGRSSPGSAP